MFNWGSNVKLGASSRWSFHLNSAWGIIETTTIGKTHPSLEHSVLTQYKQTLLVVEYENQQEYEYHEFRHIYKNDFPIFQLLLIRLIGFNILK